jgi:hypothetical protein
MSQLSAGLHGWAVIWDERACLLRASRHDFSDTVVSRSVKGTKAHNALHLGRCSVTGIILGCRCILSHSFNYPFFFGRFCLLPDSLHKSEPGHPARVVQWARIKKKKKKKLKLNRDRVSQTCERCKSVVTDTKLYALNHFRPWLTCYCFLLPRSLFHVLYIIVQPENNLCNKTMMMVRRS